jgi:hypothetical protein
MTGRYAEVTRFRAGVALPPVIFDRVIKRIDRFAQLDHAIDVFIGFWSLEAFGERFDVLHKLLA